MTRSEKQHLDYDSSQHCFSQEWMGYFLLRESMLDSHQSRINSNYVCLILLWRFWRLWLLQYVACSPIFRYVFFSHLVRTAPGVLIARDRFLKPGQLFSRQLRIAKNRLQYGFGIDLVQFVVEWALYWSCLIASCCSAAQLLMPPGGALFPSHATLFLAPVGSAKACREKQQTFDGERQSNAYKPQTIRHQSNLDNDQISCS